MDQNPSSAQTMELSGRAVLSIRLWTAADAPAEEIFWQSPPPVAALTLDLINACQWACQGEAPTTLGNGLNVSFSGLTAAVLAARRVQWAVSGLAESANGQRPAAAMLIRITQDPERQPAPASLPQALLAASPGQILLEQSVSTLLTGMPGIAVRGDEQEGFRLLEWQSSGNPATARDDDALLRQTLRERGIADPVASPVSQTSRIAKPPAAPVTSQRPAATPDLPPQIESQSAWRQLTSTLKPWHYATTGAALLVLVVVIVFASHRGSSSKAAQASSPPVPVTSASSTPAAGANAPVQPPTPQSHTPSAPIPKKKERQSKPVPDNTIASPKSSAGPCSLNGSEVPAALDEASASLQSGRYADAERKFRSVLACDPTNARALRGHERARAGLELHSSASKP